MDSSLSKSSSSLKSVFHVSSEKKTTVIDDIQILADIFSYIETSKKTATKNMRRNDGIDVGAVVQQQTQDFSYEYYEKLSEKERESYLQKAYELLSNHNEN